MAFPILILGKSGSGKSASLRSMVKTAVINVVGKPLPFKQEEDKLAVFNTDNYQMAKQAMLAATSKGFKDIVIDDAGYLITNSFMRGHSTTGKGNSVFDLYNSLADDYWDLVHFAAKDLPNDVLVYFIMHEDKNEFGETKPKTIGKMLDEKVCVEGMFTVVLRALRKDGAYVFATNSDGLDCAKSPMGLFDQTFIDNDLAEVSKKIKEYYKL